MPDTTTAAIDPVRRRLAGGSALALLTLATGCGGGNTERSSDAVLPTLRISSDAPVSASGPFTVRFTFSAAVSGFSTSGITVSNGFTSSSVSKLSDTVYTVQVTPNNGIDGVVGLQVLAGAFKDASGTLSNTTVQSFPQTVNTIVTADEPTLTISHDVSGTSATGPVTFTFAFSADVSGSFAVTDIQLSAGAVASLVSTSSGMQYTAVVNLPAGTTGDLVLVVPAGSFQTTTGVANQKAYGKLLPFVIAA